MVGELWYKKVRTLYNSTDLKNVIQTYFLPLVISLTLPATLLIYIVLILSMPILRGSSWISDPYITSFAVLYGVLFTITFNNLMTKGRLSEQLYDLISELTSSALVFTVSLVFVLTETGMGPFEQTDSYAGQITGSMVGTLLLIMFITLGIFLANIIFLYPTVRSLVRTSVSLLKSRFIPPYTQQDISIKPPKQAEIKHNKKPTYAFSIGGICICLIWALAWIAQSLDELENVIEGHAHLVWHLQDILSGDPEKTVAGWTGTVEEIIAILDPVSIVLYLAILFLTLSFAMSWIYSVRLTQEKIREYFGFSRISMTAISTTFSIPLLIISWVIVDSLVMISWIIITLVLA